MLSPISRVRTVVSHTALALFASLAVASATSAQEAPEVNATLPTTSESSTVQVLVEFFGEPAALAYGRTFDRDKPRGTSSATASAVSAGRSQIAANRSEQSRVIAELAKTGVNKIELYRATRAVNGVAYQVARSDIDRLRKVAGVKAVRIIDPEFLHMSTTIPFLGIPAVWSGASPLGVTGQGVRVGIIDTGVDYQHATFGGTGALADYQANPRTSNTAGSTTFFPTPAVVGGFDFAGDTYTGSNAPAPDPNPMDCNGHGTHVASTAAGRGVRADGSPYTGPYDTTTNFTAANMRIGPGVAPNAQVYALRVFGCTGSTTLTNAAIEWSLDPNGDEDMSDHLDVINMSLGSNFGSLASTTAIAADNAARMGMIVVASAGNAGDTYTISGSPGSGQRVIATAATGDDGLPGAFITVNPPSSIANNYPTGVAPTAISSVAPAGQSGNVVLVNDGSTVGPGTLTDGCQAYTVPLNSIALVDRGGCTFGIKAQNAVTAGATALIIANNVGGLTPPGIGGTATPVANIPVVSITLDLGNAIKARLAASETVNVTFTAANLADTLAGFSSRGPRGGGGLTGVKPDLAAPGLAITAAQTGITCLSGACQSPNASGYIAGSQLLVLQGTSMAAPHAAGMMALLKERYPDRSSEEMKAIAMNTSIHDVYQFAGNVNRIGVDRAGAGRIDADKAVKATVSAFNADEAGAVSLSFVGEVVGTQTQTKRLRVVNYASTAQTFDLAIDTAVDAPGMSFSLPGGSVLTVPANSTVFVDVQVSATASQMKHVRDISADPAQSVASPASLAGLGAMPRHYITNESGYVNFSQGANKVLRVPIYAALRPASTMSAPDTLVTGGAPTGSTTIPLSGNEVCTGTLGAGPTCTGTFPTDDVSLVTPFELHAIGPKKNNIPSYANIRHVGVSFEPASGLYFFAISTWGNWGSPTDVAFNVSVDTNEDGTYDRVIFNSNAGTLATLFGVNTPAQDAFLNVVLTPPGTVTFGGAAQYVNRFSAGVANSSLFNSNVMFLAATPAQLGLPAGDTTFRYKVETCPGFNPICTTKIDAVAGPFFWNSAAQGLNFNGAHALFDLNGATIPVTWNTANMTTNGSIGGLLMHHHNTSGNRAEVIAVEGTATADLSVTQTIAGTATLGQNVTVTVVATNVAGAAATGVSVSNLLPAGLSYVSDDSGGAYTSGTGIWTIGNLATSASATINIVAEVVGTGPITVESQVSGALIDPAPGNDLASTTINVAATSVISATVTATTAAPALALSNASFDVAVTNTGAETLFNVTVVATPPAARNGLVSPAAPQTFNVASIAGGATVTVPVTVTLPDIAGTYALDVSVSAQNAATVTQTATLAVISPASITATKTVSAGPYAIGSTVTYTVTLANASANSQQNNPGDEMVDVLPSGLTLLTASAPTGATTADTANNTVRWNGKIGGNSSVAITITASINAGTTGATLNNQATVNSDADGNGSNERVSSTDDPNVVGTSNATSLLVPYEVSSFTKTVSAPSRTLNSAVTYTITIVNSANAALADNPTDEMVDVLPAGLTLVSASATSGTAVATIGTNTVTWNGTLAPSASVTITINATINQSGTGQNLVNQARLNFDADQNGSNESTLLSDDPSVAGAANATAFDALAVVVPTLGWGALVALALLLVGFARVRLLRSGRI